MEKQFRIWAKLALTVILTVLFIWLIARDVTNWQLKQPEGDLVKAEDVKILTMELLQAGDLPVDRDEVSAFWQEYTGQYLDYGTYKQLLGYLDGKEKDYLFDTKYKDEFWLLEKDWYSSYEKLLGKYGLKDEIREMKLALVASDSNLTGDKRLEDHQILCGDGEIYTWISSDFEEIRFATVEAFVHGNRLLTLRRELPDEQTFINVWIMESNDQEIRFFDGTYEISLSIKELAPELLGKTAENAGETQSAWREQIADLTFGSGKLKDVQIKKEKVGGKLLSFGDGKLELEGYGVLELQDNCTGYQLYDTLKKAGIGELSIGYSFADFVLEDGKVCAFLITRKERMENIRVAIKDNTGGGIYHKSMEFYCEDPMRIVYGEYADRREETIPAGQVLTIESDSSYLKGGRVEIYTDLGTGRIELRSQLRAYGVPSYRGMMEIADTKQGLVLINELPLEEYLYSVVPSEMPASYPIEALKAQAVCARTYGYRYLEQPGYQSIGAHLDDSVSYQVYNNITENVNSTRAVKETSGIVLKYAGEPVNVYYYSTSCGFSSDAGVWNEQQKEEMPYLRSEYIGDFKEGESLLPENLRDEECFAQYISETDDAAYEREEPWFRWTYTVEELDTALISDRLRERYEAVPQKVLHAKEEDGGEVSDFVSEKPGKIKKIYDIRCLRRKEGGVIDELLLETDQGTYKIISEYNIRYILNQGGDVIRQDGSSYQSNTLLPSAYMIINVVKSEQNVVGYTIFGGGYGHGVGMSQNGARAMGLAGMNCEEILAFYFANCRVENVY